MKQIAIIMSLVLSVFILNGCGDKDEKNGEEDCDVTKKDCVATKEACEAKGEDWIWDEASKQCKAVVSTTEDMTKEACEAKGEDWIWDEASKQCKAVASTTEDVAKETCKAKGEGWTWDETSKHCNEVAYMTITVPSESDNNFQVIGGRKWDKYLKVYWLENGFSVTVSPGECVKISEFNLSTLSVSIAYTYTVEVGRGADNLCYHRPVGPDWFPRCPINNYKLAQRSSEDGWATLVPLPDDAVDLDSCREISPQ